MFAGLAMLVLAGSCERANATEGNYDPRAGCMQYGGIGACNNNVLRSGQWYINAAWPWDACTVNGATKVHATGSSPNDAFDNWLTQAAAAGTACSTSTDYLATRSEDCNDPQQQSPGGGPREFRYNRPCQYTLKQTQRYNGAVSTSTQQFYWLFGYSDQVIRETWGICPESLGHGVSGGNWYTFGGFDQYVAPFCTLPRWPPPKTSGPPKCSNGVGNPIDTSTGNKYQESVDYAGPGPRSLSFVRTYNSQTWASSADLGWYWGHVYDLKLEKLIGSVDTRVVLHRRGNKSLTFVRQVDGSYKGDLDIASRLVELSSGGITTGWRYTDLGLQRIEAYDALGNLQTITTRDNYVVALTYASNKLAAVTDSFGRSLTFGRSSTGSIASFSDPAGNTHAFTYGPDANGVGQLPIAMTRPDNATLRYTYTTGPYSGLLESIIDENNNTYAFFTYSGYRGLSTEHAGGVEKYSLSTTELYAGGTAYVTDPTGAQTTRQFSIVNGEALLTAQSQPAGAGCAASSTARSYDTNSNVASADDFNGRRVCSAHDLGRNLETTRVEGLANTQACSAVTGSGATLPTGSRKTSTLWHPDWRLEAKRAEPGKLTTSIYHGQPDPFNGNALASCAPSTALLPDGKPIAVLCKEVEQATSDANGSQGFSASLQSGVASGARRWTYNSYGQVLTERDPQNNLTTYTYYTDTTADHTLGDLQTVTNTKNQITTHTKYNKHGQLLESIDANGVTTSNTYGLRQRLLSTRVGGQTTSYEYDAAGQLLKVTQPDTSWIGFEYDAAHRQTAVKDSLGNRIEHVLDNAGNKTGQSVKDPGGSLARSLSQSIDALGRVQQMAGRE
ncbi:RHS repeat domain-containing protein [Pseudomonas sp. P5_A2_2]